jgi:hypothetical protein
VTQDRSIAALAGAILAVCLSLQVASGPAPVAGEGPAAAPSPGIELMGDLPAGLSMERTLMRSASRPAVPDLVAALWTCPRCGSAQTLQRLLPQQPPLDQASDVAGLLARVGLGQGGVWPEPKAETCTVCRWSRGKGEAPAVGELIFFRYLPETGSDAVARAAVRDGRLGGVGWGRLDPAGNYDDYGKIAGAAAFAAVFGRPLAVREAWAELIGKTITTGETQLLRVGSGAFITCRRRGADAAEEARLTAALHLALVGSGLPDPERAAWVPLTDVSRVPDGAGLPGYRVWLSGQARQLEGGGFLAAAAVSREEWLRLIRRELPAGGAVLTEGGAGRPAGIRAGEFTAPVDIEQALARTVYTGLSPGEGLVQFVQPEALMVEKMRRAGDEARRVLGHYETRVADGAFLEVREPPVSGAAAGSGRQLARLNIAALAGAVDARQPGAMETALNGLIGLDPTSGRICPPSLDDLDDGRATDRWLAVKLRPRGYYREMGASVLTTEFRGLDAAWSIDSARFSRLLPAAHAPSGEEMARRFAAGVEKCSFHVGAAKGLMVENVEVRAALGVDIAGTLFHERLRRGLAVRLKVPQVGVEVCFWTPDTNVVFMSQRPLPERVREHLRGIHREMLSAAGLSAGHAIELEIREKLNAPAAGVFTGG